VRAIEFWVVRGGAGRAGTLVAAVAAAPGMGATKGEGGQRCEGGSRRSHGRGPLALGDDERIYHLK
jgi:hypothetical protein